ncbi:ABC transporter ATP-binding protein [Phaeacidiphilus oryzae]|uniref:ABC transporter ATP-binding protein n=1 Tax=Phaeacidiphilus oryzae TaxID=348818 RepID=UPI0007C64FBD|nr:ABC transporter ATP-binding protein [Phaeacidiphilus oryzae]
MQPVQILHTSGVASSGGSGLSGPIDLGEPDRDRGRPAARGLRERLARSAASAAATAVGFGRVFALVWRAGPGLTLALGAATVLTGLVPAAVAVTGRALINTVVRAVDLRARHLPDRVPMDLRFPWGTAHVAPLPAVTAVLVLAVAQFGVYALSTVCGTVRSITQQLLQEKAAQSVQLRVMEHTGRLDLPFFEGARSYDLIRQAQQEASTRPVTMIGGAFNLVQTGITFVGMAALLLGLSPWLALVALLAPVPAFVSDARYGMRGFLLALWTSPVRRRMEYLSRLVTTDTYAKEVKVFGLAPYLTERYRLLGAASYRRLRATVTRRYLAGGAWNSVTVLAGAATYLYVAMAAVTGRLSLGDLTLYTAAATSLQAAVQGIFQGLSGMYENNLYLDKLYELLSVPVAGADSAPVPLPSPLRGHIVFENVSFRYPGSTAYALREVCFEILPGQTLAVVGQNGAGKSTLVKLLCRLYEPAEGRILLDGTDIRAYDPEELRSVVGALFQDFVSYQATAAENIGLGQVQRLADCDRPEGMAEIERAARRAGADALLAGLPEGYRTALGKWFADGVELSGGQWQKVALARAFLRDEAALLVLDEPTSALDAEAEHELFTRLGELARGRTTIYISHRFSTVRRADRILLLEDGRAAEQGTHDELMALEGGHYARLFALQAAGYLSGPADEAAGNGSANGTANAVKEAKIAAALAAKGLSRRG